LHEFRTAHRCVTENITLVRPLNGLPRLPGSISRESLTSGGRQKRL
jgi:hypothetical protein